MFNKNKKQYINILQQNKQVKLDYKTIQDDIIIEESNASFLKIDNTLPSDAKAKINSLQNNIKNTCIASLFESPEQYIVPTEDVDIISFSAIELNDKLSIVVPKNEINSASNYYKETGVDFILSPYSIIEEYLEDNAKKNSLNFLVYNNIIYAIIFNHKKELTYNKIKSLTPFESTQDETFVKDDIVGQKIYEEVSFLEIQEFINDTIAQYYEKFSDVEFLEHIQILYTLRPMSDEQIKLLQDILIIPVTYKAISIDSYMDEIIQGRNPSKHNFVDQREKQEKKNTFFWIIFLIATILAIIFIFNLQVENKDAKTTSTSSIQKEILIKDTNRTVKEEVKIVEPVMITLPNHIKINQDIVQNIRILFDVLPYDAVLKDVEINKNSSTFVTNFIKTSNSILDMQTKLKNFYSESKILLEHENKIILNTIIQNNNLLPQYQTNKDTLKENYKKLPFLSSSQATKYLKDITIQGSMITFDSKNKSDYLTYNFTVTSEIKSPEEFFSFIQVLNTQKHSIQLIHPIVFSRKTESVEVKFKVSFNQQNKKQVSLKK